LASREYSNIEWTFDLQHRKVENASRRQREQKARERKDLAAALMQRAASIERMVETLPQYAPTASGSQGSVSSPWPSSSSPAPRLVLQESLLRRWVISPFDFRGYVLTADVRLFFYPLHIDSRRFAMM
jgi:hypothetical protein